MKKATVQILALFAVVTMAAACGSDDGNTTTTTTTTDSGAAVDGASTDTASADTTTGSDAGTTAGDTATAAGDTATAAGDTATAGDAGTATTGGKGCTGADDQAFLKSLATDKTKAGALAKLVYDCTINKGCLNKADAAAKKTCMNNCVATDKFATDNKMTAACAECFGTYQGFCGADKCLSDCVADSNAKKCVDCRETNCTPNYDKCLAGKL